MDEGKSDKAVQQLFLEDAELWISWQVLREFIVQATHPRTFDAPLAIEEVVEAINAVSDLFHIADETFAVHQQLQELLINYPTRGKQVHDANIAATMLVYGIDTLLTLNIADFQRFSDQIKLVSPEPSAP